MDIDDINFQLGKHDTIIKEMGKTIKEMRIKLTELELFTSKILYPKVNELELNRYQ